MKKLLKELGKRIYFKDFWFIYLMYVFGIVVLSACGFVGLFDNE